MKIDHPTDSQIPQLLQMWKGAFGDHGGFWEMFLRTAFVPENCRCICRDGQLRAALYWFDVDCGGQKMAYLYAVVTHPEYRGKGLCRRLIEDTHAYLAEKGYSASLLVPETEGLRRMYREMGYEDCTAISELSCAAGGEAVSLRAIGPGEYAALRRKFLPQGGVIQEGKNLDLLAADARFYIGETFLMAAYMEGKNLHAMELLGDPHAAPGILAALNCPRGVFRIPGEEKPFAMFHPLTANAQKPAYFGFAFD